MEVVKYDELRKILIEEVQNYNGQSLIRLNIDKEVIEQIFFIPKIETYIEDGRAHKEIRGKVFAPNIPMDILEKSILVIFHLKILILMVLIFPNFKM